MPVSHLFFFLIIVNLNNSSTRMKLKLREVKRLAESHTAACGGADVHSAVSNSTASSLCTM